MQSFAHIRTQTLPEIPYQYIPPQIKSSDLQSNFKLLDDQTTQQLEQYLRDKPFNRYGKENLKKEGIETKFGIYYGKGGIFAIFNENGKQFQLGGGNYGYVKELQNLKTCEWDTALKIQKLLKKGSKKIFIQECRILNKLGQSSDPEGVIRESKKGGEKGNITMILASGSELFEYMLRRSQPETPAQEANDFAADVWPDGIWLDIACEVLEAIKIEFHDKNIFHMDIKIENLMWDLARQKLRAIDVGLSHEYQLDDQGNKYFKGSIMGTPTYIAPELYEQFSKNRPCIYTEKTEVFALGIVLKHLLFNHTIQINKKTRKREELPLSKKKTLFEQDEELGVVNFLNMMTDEKASERPTMAEAIDTLHKIRQKFIQKYPENLEASNVIYAKAIAAETERLKKLYSEVQQRSDAKEEKEIKIIPKEQSSPSVSKVSLFSEKKAQPASPSLKSTEISDIDNIKELLQNEKDENKIIQQLGKEYLAKLNDENILHLIFTATVFDHPKVISYFAKHGFKIDVDKLGITPALIAASKGSSEMLVTLSDLGIDVNKPSQTERTAAMVAQEALIEAKSNRDEAAINKYIHVLDTLYDICHQKTITQYKSSITVLKPGLLTKDLFNQLLNENIKKAGLMSYDRQLHDFNADFALYRSSSMK